MDCQKCGSNRVMGVSGKTSDMFYGQYKNYEINGYVPYDIGIGGGDYIDFNYCLKCGQMQGAWPRHEPDKTNEWSEM